MMAQQGALGEHAVTSPGHNRVSKHHELLDGGVHLQLIVRQYSQRPLLLVQRELQLQALKLHGAALQAIEQEQSPHPLKQAQRSPERLQRLRTNSGGDKSAFGTCRNSPQEPDPTRTPHEAASEELNLEAKVASTLAPRGRLHSDWASS